MFSEQPFVVQSSIMRFRWTTESDLDTVVQLEQDEDNQSFIIPWQRELHAAACTDPDQAHLIIETGQEGHVSGFLLLAGRASAHRSIEFRRIVISDKGNGYGKEALRLVKQLVFEQWQAHRLWLDVFDYNKRARHLYASQGFVEEGVLRECIAAGDRFESLVVMSLLAQEYAHS